MGDTFGFVRSQSAASLLGIVLALGWVRVLLGRDVKQLWRAFLVPAQLRWAHASEVFRFGLHLRDSVRVRITWAVQRSGLLDWPDSVLHVVTSDERARAGTLADEPRAC